MKKALLAAGVALSVLGGVGLATPASADSFSVTIGSHPHHHHGHYWWHGRWYESEPVGYYYVAPPYPYEHPYWHKHWRRYHHCRDWDNDGDCH